MTTKFRFAAVFWGAICLLGLSGAAAAQTSSNAPGSDDVKVTHYQDWTVRCDPSADATKCEMTQLVDNPNSNTPLMRVIMGYPPQIGSPVMVFILPLGTQLAPGLRVSVDDSQPLRIPFRVCLESGCRSSFPVKASLLKKFKLGDSITVSLIGPRGDQMNLDVSLLGFTASSEAITP